MNQLINHLHDVALKIVNSSVKRGTKIRELRCDKNNKLRYDDNVVRGLRVHGRRSLTDRHIGSAHGSP